MRGDPSHESAFSPLEGHACSINFGCLAVYLAFCVWRRTHGSIPFATCDVLSLTWQLVLAFPLPLSTFIRLLTPHV
jgi:hypothetical protein